MTWEENEGEATNAAAVATFQGVAVNNFIQMYLDNCRIRVFFPREVCYQILFKVE